MNSETKLLARDIYASIMTNTTGLDTISKEQRAELFKAAAQICFEAASAFETVESEL
jgi:hypothetical protein